MARDLDVMAQNAAVDDALREVEQWLLEQRRQAQRVSMEVGIHPLTVGRSSAFGDALAHIRQMRAHLTGEG